MSTIPVSSAKMTMWSLSIPPQRRLIGQVAADAISADKIFSGAGGFVDFVRGASFSKGGKSIIAMPSTAMGGKASRIVDQFEAGRQ